MVSWSSSKTLIFLDLVLLLLGSGVVIRKNIVHIPYSVKFSRHLYFVDWPLKAILLHNVRGMTAYRKPRL